LTEPEPGGEESDLDSMEDLIARILSQRKDLTRERIQELIGEKKHEAHDLLSEEGAARLVAEELLVETERAETLPSISIAKLVAGLNDVTLTAKVEAVEPVKGFVRQDGSAGQVMRILLSDETGKIACAVWDAKADEIARLGDLAGKSIDIRHSYTRAGLAGEVELNASERCEITTASDIETSRKIMFIPIGEIKEPAIDLNLRGAILSVPRVYEFSRNGQKGTVLRTVLADKSGSVPLVAWNERAEDLRGLKRGQILEIQKGRLRRDNSGRLEVHLDDRAKTEIQAAAPEGFEVPEIKFHKVAELRPDLPTVNLVARIVGKSDSQQVQRPSGERVAVSRILAGDETGILSASLWDDKAELASHLRIGDTVQIEDAMPNLRLGQLSISVGRTASIQRVENPEREIQVRISKIRETTADSKIVAVEGEVVGEPEAREVTTGKGEKVRVTSAQVRDDTGEARVSFWRSHATEASKLEPGAKIRVYGLVPRQGLADGIELNTIQASSFELLTPTLKDRPSSDEIRQFIGLKENEQAWVRALVLDPGDDALLSSVCTQCEEPAVPSDDQFLCPTHGAQDDVTWLLTMSMRLDDGTDTIVAKVRTRDPQSLIGKSLASAQKEILAKNTGTVALPIDATGKLAGMRVEAFAVTKRDPQTGKLVLHTEKVFLQD